jgi:hypothetical protein
MHDVVLVYGLYGLRDLQYNLQYRCHVGGCGRRVYVIPKPPVLDSFLQMGWSPSGVPQCAQADRVDSHNGGSLPLAGTSRDCHWQGQ